MELSRKIQYLRSYNSFEWDKIIYRKPLITDAMKIWQEVKFGVKLNSTIPERLGLFFTARAEDKTENKAGDIIRRENICRS